MHVWKIIFLLPPSPIGLLCNNNLSLSRSSMDTHVAVGSVYANASAFGVRSLKLSQ